MKRKFFTSTDKKGFSLLELLLSIGIIALIILMATRYFTTARNAQLASAAVQQIQGIRAATSTLIANGTAAAGEPNVITMICNQGSLPTGSCDTSSTTPTIISPWDTTTGDKETTVKVALATDTTHLFTLVYAFPTSQACNSVMNSFTKDIDTTAAGAGCAAPSGGTKTNGTFVFNR